MAELFGQPLDSSPLSHRRGSIDEKQGGGTPSHTRAAGGGKKSSVEDAVWSDAVKGSVLLSRLTKEELRFVRSAARLTKLATGATVYEEGTPTSDSGNFYIVLSGRYAASHALHCGSHRRLREYGAADCFGSHELLHNTARTTTVRVLEGGTVWHISRRVFDSKLRLAASSLKLPPTLSLEALRGMTLFSGVRPESLAMLGGVSSERAVPAGALVCSRLLTQRHSASGTLYDSRAFFPLL